MAETAPKPEIEKLTEKEIKYLDSKTNYGKGGISEKLSVEDAKKYIEYLLHESALTEALVKIEHREMEKGDPATHERLREIIRTANKDVMAELKKKYADVIQKAEAAKEEIWPGITEGAREKKTKELGKKYREEFVAAMEKNWKAMLEK